MRRALIGNGKTPTSGSSSSPLCIAAKRNRSRTGNDNHSRASAEGSCQRDLHVAHDFDFPGNDFCNDLADGVCYFRASGTRGPNARTGHLLEINSCCAARLTYRLMQSCASAGLAHTRDVATSDRNRGENRGFVAHHTCCLASAPVNAQIVGHALVLSQEKFRIPSSSLRNFGSIFPATSIKTHSRGTLIPAII